MEGFKRMTDMHITIRTALLERLAQEAADYLQTRFVEAEQLSPEEKAYWEAETDKLNEIAVRKQGEPMFSHDKHSSPLHLENYSISRTDDDYFRTFRIPTQKNLWLVFSSSSGVEKTKPIKRKSGLPLTRPRVGQSQL